MSGTQQLTSLEFLHDGVTESRFNQVHTFKREVTVPSSALSL